MPPKQQKKTPKKTNIVRNIVRPAPGGVKKRSELTAYARKAVGGQVLLGSAQERKNRLVENAYRQRPYRHKLDIYMFEMKVDAVMSIMRHYRLFHPSVPRATKFPKVQKASRQLWRALVEVFSEIVEFEAGGGAPPVMVFDQGRSLTMSAIDEYVKEAINQQKYERQYARNHGEAFNNSRLIQGFDSDFIVPLGTLDTLISIGFLETLTTFRREVFMAHYKWIKQHTPPIVRKYLNGQRFSNANLAKVRGTTYTLNLLRGAAPMNTAASRKRTR